VLPVLRVGGVLGGSRPSTTGLSPRKARERAWKCAADRGDAAGRPGAQARRRVGARRPGEEGRCRVLHGGAKDLGGGRTWWKQAWRVTLGQEKEKDGVGCLPVLYLFSPECDAPRVGGPESGSRSTGPLPASVIDLEKDCRDSGSRSTQPTPGGRVQETVGY
jgi:hypothetical protein